jgi:hypothetical protein
LAIVQISRITQRKGLQENLPQLAGAELGWSTDERRLFIGNGTLDEGAPIIGNTELLTEFSDILVLAQDYTYSGQAATGYTVQTGPSPGTPIQSSLQNWMDQFASVKDFGAVGNGVADDTAAINRALYQIYCREINPAIRRSIFFPAGIYRVTDKIIIPTYATLCGEGATNSVIQMDAVTSAQYVVVTGDSLQQTGADIGLNGAAAPTSITVMDMGFKSLAVIDIALVDKTTNTLFTRCEFKGPLTTAELVTDADNVACVKFESTASLETQQIEFNNCRFTGTTWAVNTDQQVRGIGFGGSHFQTLYQGILTATNPTVGENNPRGIVITNCDFDIIYAEAIVYNTERNGSYSNTFGDVGNHFGGTTQPYTAVINFAESNNISVGDLFDRTDDFAVQYPRVQLNGTASIAFTNGQQLALGPYVIESGLTNTLLDNQASPVTAFSYAEVGIFSFKINYNISRNGFHRIGVISIVLDTGVAPLTWSDEYSENANTGIVLSITQTGSAVFIKYTSTNTGLTGSFTHSVTHI